jgi:hypothetical protein
VLRRAEGTDAGAVVARGVSVVRAVTFGVLAFGVSLWCRCAASTFDACAGAVSAGAATVGRAAGAVVVALAAFFGAVLALS